LNKVFNSDTAHITQLKQQKSDIMAMCCKSNSTFLIFAVLVV